MLAVLTIALVGFLVTFLAAVIVYESKTELSPFSANWVWVDRLAQKYRRMRASLSLRKLKAFSPLYEMLDGDESREDFLVRNKIANAHYASAVDRMYVKEILIQDGVSLEDRITSMGDTYSRSVQEIRSEAKGYVCRTPF